MVECSAAGRVSLLAIFERMTTVQFSPSPYEQNRSSTAAITFTLAVLLVAGCSEPTGVTEDATTVARSADSTAVAPQPPAPATVDVAASMPRSNASEVNKTDADSATVGGDGSAINLAPLSAAEIQSASLSGELGCSFSTSASLPIFVAMGDVASRDAAQGVAKVGSYVERVAAPGGFDAMLKGVTFSGAGKTIRIDPIGPARGGGESPPRPATLTYDRADGARRTLAGWWSCGP